MENDSKYIIIDENVYNREKIKIDKVQYFFLEFEEKYTLNSLYFNYNNLESKSLIDRNVFFYKR